VTVPAPTEATVMTSFGVAINVVDIDRSVDFYVLLGLREITRFSPAEGVEEAVLQWPGSAGPNLLLVSSQDRSGAPAIGTGLSCLVVFIENLSETCDTLTAAGLEVGGSKVLDNGVTVAFASDPDNYPIELIQTSPAVASR
jgi:catechol 2,3-dioxygenase-like lactoylglutathione lyase family enzyme